MMVVCGSNYTMERYGSRLVCLRHSGVNVPDAAAVAAALAGGVAAPTPERISLEASDSGAREIDEDEWTDRLAVSLYLTGSLPFFNIQRGKRGCL